MMIKLTTTVDGSPMLVNTRHIMLASEEREGAGVTCIELDKKTDNEIYCRESVNDIAALIESQSTQS